MERVNREVERVRKWFYRQLEFIKLYPSESHRLILILSVRIIAILAEKKTEKILLNLFKLMQ